MKSHKVIHNVSLYIPLVVIVLIVVALSLLHTQIGDLFKSKPNTTSSTQQ